MSYPLYIIFGVLPSIIWLLFYLRKDIHPESRRMILKIFFYGMMAALPAMFLEIAILNEFAKLNLFPVFSTVFNTFIAVALIEEFLKYLVVREKVMNSSELDEPVDVLLYMIISALGFAASENILILISAGNQGSAAGGFLFSLEQIVSVSIFRFLGATFLHALCSGLLGFFLAFSIYNAKKRGWLLAAGFLAATLLHGFYNFSIMEIKGTLSFLIPIIILISLAAFLTFGFKRLKEIKSVCKIN